MKVSLDWKTIFIRFCTHIFYKRKNLSSTEKAHTAGLYLDGTYSYDYDYGYEERLDRCRYMGEVNQSSNQIIKLFNEDPEYERRKGSSWARKTTKKDDCHIPLEIKRNPHITRHEIKRKCRVRYRLEYN